MRVTFQVLLLCFIITVMSFPAGAISFDEARHLLVRTGFGVAQPEQIEALRPMSYEQAVEHILSSVDKAQLLPSPQFKVMPGKRPKTKDMTAEARRKYNKDRKEDNQALKEWWFRQMLTTTSPLGERMALFWSNHFVSEIRKVKFSLMMYEQHMAFRKHGLGNFGDLLKEISIGPAMLIYLDANKNVKGKPNENFAREVLELFTLGEGKGYSERDIREAARAFTGWRVNRKKGIFVTNKKHHDLGEKSIFGETGFFDGMDVLGLILKQDRVAEFITEKLWQEFVSTTLDENAIRRLAADFRKNGLQIRPLLRTILMSKAFRSDENRGTMIKSPVELVVGTVRLLNISSPPIKKFKNIQFKMGQTLFDPPDVKGWRTGTDWISATTTLLRRQYVDQIRRIVKTSFQDQKKTMSMAEKVSVDIAGLMSRQNHDKTYLRRLLLPMDPILAKSGKGNNWQALVSYMYDPVYQLK